MSASLDTQKFSEMIKSKRGKIGLRQLATEIGISASTLSRVEQGNLPDIDTYIKLCEWLEVSTDYFTTNTINQDTQNEVVAFLRADKTLPPATSEALIQMIKLAYDSAVNKD
ncbi:MAG: helix-turn-helix domain-containing protein [Rikenellaceae bacterium]|nr:helix-turn-helix domain-containing protein [Rikenellaceae bacterium]